MYTNIVPTDKCCTSNLESVHQNLVTESDVDKVLCVMLMSPGSASGDCVNHRENISWIHKNCHSKSPCFKQHKFKNGHLITFKVNKELVQVQ